MNAVVQQQTIVQQKFQHVKIQMGDIPADVTLATKQKIHTNVKV